MLLHDFLIKYLVWHRTKIWVLDSAGNMVSSAFNKISEKMGGGKSEDMAKSPLQKIIDFANQAKSISKVSAGLDLLLKSFDKMSNMEACTYVQEAYVESIWRCFDYIWCWCRHEQPEEVYLVFWVDCLVKSKNLQLKK